MRHTGVMLALAIVLLVIVLLLVVVSFAGSSEELVIDFLNVTITTSVGGVFVAGVVSGLIALASALALRRSWRRRQARADEVRELRRLAGVPDPDEHEPAADTKTDSPSQASSSSTESARANLSSPSNGNHDTAPIPGTEDPPRT
jgi:hypothetical protein